MADKLVCPGCGAEYDPESGEAHFHEPDPPELPPEAVEPEPVPPEAVPAPAPRARNRFRRD
jgi:hypothetical protein